MSNIFWNPFEIQQETYLQSWSSQSPIRIIAEEDSIVRKKKITLNLLDTRLDEIDFMLEKAKVKVLPEKL